MGLALAATSIGITSRVLAELGVLDRAFARVILGAAIVDDILALLAIGLLSGLAEGDLGPDTFLFLGAGVAFVVIGLAIAPMARRLSRDAFVWPKVADTPVVPVFILMFAGALLATIVGLAAIIAAVLAVTGVITKLVGGMVGAWRLGRWNATVVGLGMGPRGEVGIVVAALGLSLGLIDGDTYAVVLAAVVATTLAAPVMLRWAISRARRSERHHPAVAPVVGPA